MLYRTTVKPEADEQLNAIRTRFSEIYAKNGIEATSVLLLYLIHFGLISNRKNLLKLR